MALTLNQFCGFETGGLEEITGGTFGSPDATEAVIVRSGERSLELPGGSFNGVRFGLFDDVASAGNDHIFGFGIYFASGISVSSNLLIFGVTTAADSTAGIQLRLNSTSELEVLNITGIVTDGTISNPFNADAWNYVEVYWQNANSGAWEVFVNDASVGSGSGEDFLGSAFAECYLQNGTPSANIMYFDDFYWLSGATAATDRLGPGVSVLGYQGNKSSNTPDFDSSGTAGGSDLDGGNGTLVNLWDRLSERGWDDSRWSGYHASGTLSGCIAFDGTNASGAEPGPLTGSQIVSGTIKGAKWAWRADRNGGGGTTQQTLYGVWDGSGNMDSIVVDSITLIQGTIANFFKLNEGAEVPTALEDFVMGFANDGGRDFDCYEMQAFLLHVSSTTVTDLSDGLMPEYPSPGLTVEV